MTNPPRHRSHARLAFNTALNGGMLCIAWAVVVPQFHSTICPSPTAAMQANLCSVRAALAAYATDRDGIYPVDPERDLFRQQPVVPLTGGNPKVRGPYLRHGLPGSFLDKRKNVLVVDRMPDEANGRTAWIYAQGSGDFRVNHTGCAPSGERWFDL